jgi:hypothetical protein
MLFQQHMRVLLKRRNKSWSFVYLMTTSIVIFILITIVSLNPSSRSHNMISTTPQHAIVDLNHAYTAFTDDMATPNAPLREYSKFNTFREKFRTSIYCITALISDLFLVSMVPPGSTSGH